MSLPITALVAVALGLQSIYLSTRVSLLRGKLGVALGDGNHPALLERMRQHGNLMEAAPLALILLGLAEGQGVATGWIYAAAAILLAARLIHPFGVRHDQPGNRLRIIGALGTTISMLIAALGILWIAMGM